MLASAEGRRQLGDDAGQDDQRDAVADAARGDLLAEPHQEHGAAGQRDRGRQAEEQAGIGHDVTGALEADGDAVRLERRQDHGQVARVLVQGLAAGLAFLLQRLELGRDGGQKLDDDRCRDVRHDVQRKNRHAVDAAAGEHIEHAEDAARLGAEHLFPDVGIDAGQRDVGAESINKQRTQGEPDALLQLVGLRQRSEIEVCRKLFRC
jgi:hypothetical protein